MSSHDGELEAIRRRYANRATLPADRYSRWNADVLARVHERQLATTSLLAANGIHSLAGLDMIEVGCGDGANLIEFLQLGAEPQRLVGNDLLSDRIAQARRLLPESVRLYPGDASALAFDPGIVRPRLSVDGLQLDPRRLAAGRSRRRRCGSWLRPGGAVLWYDFTIDNPRNPDVRGVPVDACPRAVSRPAGSPVAASTLAPPLARAVSRVYIRPCYTVFNLLPLLRTHILCWIQKP